MIKWMQSIVATAYCEARKISIRPLGGLAIYSKRNLYFGQCRRISDMKKLTAFILASVLVLVFTACNSNIISSVNNSPTTLQNESPVPVFPLPDYKLTDNNNEGYIVEFAAEWFEWFNSLSVEEQSYVSFRPHNFVRVQREVYGIDE